jgi:hypothetical protein
MFFRINTTMLGLLTPIFMNSKTAIENNMFVVPIYFGKRHKEMLAHCKRLIEENGLVAIHPRYDKLLIALRTATERDGKLDKEATSHDDLFDSFSMSLQFWH